MKRIILSFAVLTLLMVYNVYSEGFLIKYCEETLNMLEICAENIKKEAYSEAEVTADKLLDSWEKHNTLLSVIIGDSDISKSYGNIVAISRCLDDSTYEECLSAIRDCQGNIREIKEQNRTGLGNVL